MHTHMHTRFVLQGFMPSLAAFLATAKISKIQQEQQFALSQFFTLHESKGPSPPLAA